MKSDNSFSRREWIFLVLILMLVQFLIHWMSLKYGSSVSALGYVSFAGTVVSILLGLIAIIYAFVQSFTQANSVVEVREQIEKLILAGDDIVRSKDELHRSALELSGITEGLSNRLAEHTIATLEFKTEFGNLSTTLVAEKNSIVPGGSDAQDGSAASDKARSVFSGTRVWLVLMVLSFAEGIDRKYTLDEVKNRILTPVGERLGHSEDLMSGMFVVFLFVLEAEGFLKVPENAAGNLGVDIEFDGDFVGRARETFSRKRTRSFKELAVFWAVVDGLS